MLATHLTGTATPTQTLDRHYLHGRGRGVETLSDRKENKIELHWGQNPLNCLLLLFLYHSCFL